MSYSHLTAAEREKILIYKLEGLTVSQIARRLSRNKSTISRELKRNSSCSSYSAVDAQTRYEKRRKKCHRHSILENEEIFTLVKDKFLSHQWSPEQIAGRLKAEDCSVSISTKTIYRAIYAGMFNQKGLSHGNRGAIRKLRHKGKTRHTKDYVERRGKIQISHPLSERPIEAQNRSRIGDWEGDTVAGVTGKACLVTLVDRKTRYLVGGKASKKSSKEVSEVMVKALKDEPVKTITPDRGKEFSNHKEVTEQLDQVQFYFPLPHHPWDRGTNENTNGLLREYFPKGEDLTGVTDEYIEQVFYELNTRPRKCLNWKTPYELYHDSELHLM
jgi:IS30 family transposase